MLVMTVTDGTLPASDSVKSNDSRIQDNTWTRKG